MKVIMYPAITLDGFIADLKGECYSWIDDVDEAEYRALMRQCGADIVGRKTYMQYKDDYDKRRDIVTFICTNSDEYSDTDNLKFINGSAQDMINKIQSYGFTETVLSGGGEINGLFAEVGFVNEIRASIYPLTLGQGIPLFGSRSAKLQLELISSKVAQKGILQNVYHVTAMESA